MEGAWGTARGRRRQGCRTLSSGWILAWRSSGSRTPGRLTKLRLIVIDHSDLAEIPPNAFLGLRQLKEIQVSHYPLPTPRWYPETCCWRCCTSRATT